MQRLEVSGAVRPIYGSLGVKRLSVLLRVRLHLMHILFMLQFGITLTDSAGLY